MEKQGAAGRTFAALLRRHRLAAGFTQEALAERARMSAQGIGALERGAHQSPYRETVVLLAEALGLSPAATAELQTAAARPRKPRSDVEFIAATAGRGPATNLPSARKSLIGRATEIAEIVRVLQDKRLVTVTGAGGIGKTRTVCAVGDALLASMKAGVWLVEFAPLTPGSFVASAVARALGVKELRNRPLLETLLTHLKHKALLLIFDNCEHVITEAAALADALVAGCPQLRILVTSRESLRIAGEHAYRLPSLPVPTAKEAPRLSAAAAAGFAAVVLFTQRAQAIDHRFVLSDDNAPIVAEICRQLDGIPLAIELAAARVKILSVHAISAKLEQRLQILTGGDRTALPRHQTMRALIDWSYDLLSPRERRLLERLSIFAGGCTAATAVAVCADYEADEFGVLDLLTSLVDKSLIVTDLAPPEPRFRLLESTREYAREKLCARGEATIVARLHALAYAECAEQLRNEILVSADLAGYARAAPELDNWRAALDWTLRERGDILLGQRLARDTVVAWVFFAPIEGRRYLKTALELANERTPAAVTAGVENAMASLTFVSGEFEAALAGSGHALAMFRELGDALGAASAQHIMGKSLVSLGRVAEGEALLRSALEAARSLGLRTLMAQGLQEIAVARSAAGDILEARACMSEALAQFRRIGSQWSMLAGMKVLADFELRAGNAERAVQLITTLPTAPSATPSFYVARHLTDLTGYLIACDRWEEARARAREALGLAREIQHDASLAWVIQHLAAIAVLSTPGDRKVSAATFDNAAQLLGYVDARTTDLGAWRQYAEQQEYDRVLRTLRCKIGTKDLVTLMARGTVMTEDQAVECALSTNTPSVPDA